MWTLIGGRVAVKGEPRELFGAKAGKGISADIAPRSSTSAVTEVLFEHSPARRDSRFTNDRTAFDAVFKCRTIHGQSAFVAIELKYTESMTDPAPRMRPRYDELSRSSQLFQNPDCISLRQNPLQQFWRQHLLAHAMVENGLYSGGRFIRIAPSHNTAAQNAIHLYRKQLADTPATVSFDAITLETVITAIKHPGATKIAKLLSQRYCDLSSVDTDLNTD